MSPISHSDDGSTRNSSRHTDSPTIDSPVSPLTAPSYDTPSVGESPISFLDQHSLFHPGWSFDPRDYTSSPSEAKAAPKGPRAKHPAVALKDEPLQHRNAFARQAPAHTQPHSPAGNTPRLAPPQRPLRAVASSPALYTRKDSKVTPPSSTVHPALRNRNASYDCQTAPPRPPRSAPRTPPPDKPLPAIPVEFRQPSKASTPPTLPAIPTGMPIMGTTFSSGKPSDDRIHSQGLSKAPPPYMEPSRKQSAERTMSDGDNLSARTRIVMDVLGHMVALLKTRDEASLLEFSSLVTAQTKDMQSKAELESAVRF